MALDEEMPANVSVRLLEAARQRTADQVELVLKLEFTRGSALPVELDLAVQIEGQQKSVTVSMEGATHEHELRFPLRKVPKLAGGAWSCWIRKMGTFGITWHTLFTANLSGHKRQWSVCLTVLQRAF